MRNDYVPERVVRVVTAQLEIFSHLQHGRYEKAALPPTVIAEVMKTKLVPQAGAIPMDANWPSLWSERYRQEVQPLGDGAVNALWGLVSTVMAILQEPDAGKIAMSSALQLWYSTYFIDEMYVEEKVQELRLMNASTSSEDDTFDIGAFFLDAIERMFFAGNFANAAALVDALINFLRTATENPFTAEMESALADVKRLLYESFDTPQSHAAWVENANGQIYEAKRVLGDSVKESGNRPISAAAHIAQDLRLLCFDMLLVISGDAQLLRTRCIDSRLTLFEYVVAACSIAAPLATLSEVEFIFKDARKDWTKDETNQWQYAIIAQLLRARCVEDVVEAMRVAGEVADKHFVWTPENMFSASPHQAECDEGDEDNSRVMVADVESEAFLNPNDCSCRRFALACMAAHVADVCAPAVVASCALIDLTFARNAVILAYLELFRYNTRLWRVAGTYAALSPLMNPVEMFNVCMYGAQVAAQDTRQYLRFSTFMRTCFDPASKHAGAMRARLQEKLTDNETVLKWLEALEFYRQRAFREAHRFIITTRFNHGDYAWAVWLAVEAQSVKPVQWELKHQLISESALTSQCVHYVGEAVQNSFIALDACATVEVARSLNVCAAVSAYVKAATQLRVCEERSSDNAAEGPTELLEASTYCLDAIEKVLSAYDECDFAAHPSTIFTLVEHAAQTLLLIKQMPVRCVAASANSRSLAPQTALSFATEVATCLVPMLAQALELTLIRHVIMRKDLSPRAGEIREALARALDPHLE